MENFTTLGLSPELERAITEMGFTKPSEIQQQALPILLDGPTDFIGLAATGTGKTAAFSIPLLEQIDPTVRAVQGLILCPTRELALQVAGQIQLMGKYKKIKALSIFGGAGYGDQIYGLKQGMNIVVGTPGRVCDHLDKGTLKLDKLKVVILDEADKMISMGFKEDLEKILNASPRKESKIWLFSATMSKEVRSVADGYLRAPKQVQVNRSEVLSAGVEQVYYMTHEGDKPDVLGRIIDAAESFYGLIFCQTKALVMDLTDLLEDRGYRVDCLHGDMDQTSRTRVTQAFRDKKVTILICTDVASRGLDVKDVTHVINYSIPREIENYVHRIGRTARSGKTGIAISLVTPSHRRLIAQIERVTKSRMKEGRAPNPSEIAKKKVSFALDTFMKSEHHAQMTELLDETWKTTLSAMSAEEVASRFLALKFTELFTKPKTAKMPARVAPVSENPVKITNRDSGGGFKPKRFDDRGPTPRPAGGGGAWREKKFGGSDRPAFGKPSFGKPAFGKPAFGKPAFGKPSFGPRPFVVKPKFDRKPKRQADELN